MIALLLSLILLTLLLGRQAVGALLGCIALVCFIALGLFASYIFLWG